jgi:hypothetical protein
MTCAPRPPRVRVGRVQGRGHFPGGLWRGPKADAVSALLGLGSKGGVGMSQVLDGHLIGCVP